MARRAIRTLYAQFLARSAKRIALRFGVVDNLATMEERDQQVGTNGVAGDRSGPQIGGVHGFHARLRKREYALRRN